MRFSGKTVLITGASLGIGRACAEGFFAEGANVVLVARRTGPLEELATALGDPSRVLVRPTDVADGGALTALIDDVRARFGALHGVINNAGAHFRGPLGERTAEQIGVMVDVNLRAPLMLARLALPDLQASGGGFIVNVASLAGKIPLGGAATYSATKFGLRAFTFALREELVGSGITVSAVSPGPVSTGFILGELDEVSPIVFSQALCTAEHVAGMVLDCAADGRRERQFPASGGRLATVGYLVPGLRRLLLPMLVRKGERVKARLKKELQG